LDIGKERKNNIVLQRHFKLLEKKKQNAEGIECVKYKLTPAPDKILSERMHRDKRDYSEKN